MDGKTQLSEYHKPILIASIVGVVIVVSLGIGIYLSPLANSQQSTSVQATTSSLAYTTYTNTMYAASVNINLSDYCPQVSAGGFEFRLVSDITGAPVNPNSISAVDMLECNGENQVANINEFSYIGRGWIVPVFPSQAMYGGGLNITVTYEGETFNFTGGIPPIGTDCVTLHVPSGNVSSLTIMNGSGSYCSQSSTSSSSIQSLFQSFIPAIPCSPEEGKAYKLNCRKI